MKILTGLLLIIAMLTGCSQREGLIQPVQLSEQDLTDLKKQIATTGLPVAILEFNGTDSLQKVACLAKLDKVKSIVNEKWRDDPAKLIVNCYTRKEYLTVELMAHSFYHGKLKTSTEIPKDITDAFENNFVCRSAEMNGLTIKQAVSFKWDTLGAKMIVRVLDVE